MTRPTLESRLVQRELPAQRHVMYQRWSHLLFAHWLEEPERIQATLPKGLFVDAFNGRAFVGAVPFYMERIRPRFLPPLPGISWFLEFNLRTYVHDVDGRPGVWFYSLDANQSLAVALARRFFHLPYFRAKMRAATGDGNMQSRSHRQGHQIQDRVDYKIPDGPMAEAESGSLEFFLLERYLLFAHDRSRDRVLSGRVFHSPYPFAEVDSESFKAHIAPVFTAAGFDPPAERPSSLLYSPRVDVKVFPTIPLSR
jgi:uncharacterized protein YqjF (DUF2071 family)